MGSVVIGFLICSYSATVCNLLFSGSYKMENVRHSPATSRLIHIRSTNFTAKLLFDPIGSTLKVKLKLV